MAHHAGRALGSCAVSGVARAEKRVHAAATNDAVVVRKCRCVADDARRTCIGADTLAACGDSKV